MILADTSIWVDHLRKGLPELASLLQASRIVIHPFVIGELACGYLVNRTEILSLLAALPQAHVADHEEVLDLLERAKLPGKGLGWIDAHLLASALLTGCALWTYGKSLGMAAVGLKLAR